MNNSTFLSPDLSPEQETVLALPGPIVVLGAETSVGAAVLRRLTAERSDAYGLALSPASNGAGEAANGSLHIVDLGTPGVLEELAADLPYTSVIDCASLSASVNRSSLFHYTLGLPDRLLRVRSVGVYVQVLSIAEGPAQPPLGEISARAASEFIVEIGHSGTTAVQVRLPLVLGDCEEARSPLTRLLAYAPGALSWPLAVIDAEAAASAVLQAACLAAEAKGATFAVAGTSVDSPEALQNLLAQPVTREAGPLSRLAPPEESSVPPRPLALTLPGDTRWSISAVTLCYHENQTIPFMYERLTQAFQKMGVDYEIIFVNNDNSPDDATELVRDLSARDPHVRGVSLTRNFNPQAAYRSGLEAATKNAVVLLDGDLQDPPELIEAFLEQWKLGYEVVYGRRVKRDAPLYLQWSYKLFYRIFDFFSYLKIPHDAGDFSLLDRRVVDCLLAFPERDLFLRGLRAYVGFRQTGIDYVRPERMFGKSSNNMARLIGWAKTGIVSFSNAPLSLISYVGTSLLLLAVLLGVVQVVARLLFPHLTPQGLTTVLLSILFFGSLNMFALGVIGEYIAKIFDEVKQRPRSIRRSLIEGGEVRESIQIDCPGAVEASKQTARR
jgi:glycosyltransferase involved in cell wall biosynthesis